MLGLRVMHVALAAIVRAGTLLRSWCVVLAVLPRECGVGVVVCVAASLRDLVHHGCTTVAASHACFA